MCKTCGGETREVWSAADALVLKATTIVLTRQFEPYLSRRCFHLAGRGGAKAAVRAVARRLTEYRFVFRSNVRRYYASIDHEIVFDQLRRVVPDRRVLNLLWRFVHRLM